MRAPTAPLCELSSVCLRRRRHDSAGSVTRRCPLHSLHGPPPLRRHHQRGQAARLPHRRAGHSRHHRAASRHRKDSRARRGWRHLPRQCSDQGGLLLAIRSRRTGRRRRFRPGSGCARRRARRALGPLCRRRRPRRLARRQRQHRRVEQHAAPAETGRHSQLRCALPATIAPWLPHAMARCCQIADGTVEGE